MIADEAVESDKLYGDIVKQGQFYTELTRTMLGLDAADKKAPEGGPKPEFRRKIVKAIGVVSRALLPEALSGPKSPLRAQNWVISLLGETTLTNIFSGALLGATGVLGPLAPLGLGLGYLLNRAVMLAARKSLKY